MGGSSGPFHEGERAVQQAAGEQEAAGENGLMIGRAIVPGARNFLIQQRMLVVASRDRQGRPWAWVLFGQSAFVRADEQGTHVTLDRSLVYQSDAEILWAGLAVGSALGLLGIDLATRRRLRVNGQVEELTDQRMVLRVEQAYPNCGKYIQRRRLRSITPREISSAPIAHQGTTPDAALIEAVKTSDTFFVASGHSSRGLDVSHRGGRPGFIEMVEPGVFRVPDYFGNSMFNTLGNLAIDPACGVALLDFNNGRVYQMTGRASLHLGAPLAAAENPALTSRWWDFSVQNWRSTELPVRMEWNFVDYSPFNPA